MKIHLLQVKDSSRDFHLEADIELPGLADRVGTGHVTADVRVNPSGERWYVNAAVEGSFPFTCDRCGASFSGRLAGDFMLVVLAKAGGDLDPEDSEEVVLLPSGVQEIDIGEQVRETLLLALPMRLLCREDCRGLCPGCGANLNEEPCVCHREDADPRWGSLQELKRKLETAEAAPAAGPKPNEVDDGRPEEA
ncbi:MAG: DUF177 domain-containing protein [Candidatus Krumholzibacteriota bacterium]|nr:DUF177 domain-containing protein [Candidatus Krumholzibacteriota bacterium]